MSDRSDTLVGTTHKIKITLPQGGKDVAFYVTVNKQDGRLYEVFVNVRHAGYWEHLTLVTVMISQLLQLGKAPEQIVATLRSIDSAVTGHINKGEGWVPSVYSRIAAVIEQEMKS